MERGVCEQHLKALIGDTKDTKLKVKGKKQCIVDGCRSKAIRKGMCQYHLSMTDHKNKKYICAIDGCFSVRHDDSPLCTKHDQQLNGRIKVETCLYEGCNNTAVAKGKCNYHYQKDYREERREKSRKEKDNKVKKDRNICTIEGCYRKVFSGPFCKEHHDEEIASRPDIPIVCQYDNCTREAKHNGYCWTHYNQIRETEQTKSIAHKEDSFKPEEKPEKRGKTTMSETKTSAPKICIVGNCTDEIYDENVCIRHYKILCQNTGKKGKCGIANCDKPLYEAGLCREHYDML